MPIPAWMKLRNPFRRRQEETRVPVTSESTACLTQPYDAFRLNTSLGWDSTVPAIRRYHPLKSKSTAYLAQRQNVFSANFPGTLENISPTFQRHHDLASTPYVEFTELQHSNTITDMTRPCEVTMPTIRHSQSVPMLRATRHQHQPQVTIFESPQHPNFSGSLISLAESTQSQGVSSMAPPEILSTTLAELDVPHVVTEVTAALDNVKLLPASSSIYSRLSDPEIFPDLPGASAGYGLAALHNKSSSRGVQLPLPEVLPDLPETSTQNVHVALRAYFGIPEASAGNFYAVPEAPSSSIYSHFPGPEVFTGFRGGSVEDVQYEPNYVPSTYYDHFSRAEVFAGFRGTSTEDVQNAPSYVPSTYYDHFSRPEAFPDLPEASEGHVDAAPNHTDAWPIYLPLPVRVNQPARHYCENFPTRELPFEINGPKPDLPKYIDPASIIRQPLYHPDPLGPNSEMASREYKNILGEDGTLTVHVRRNLLQPNLPLGKWPVSPELQASVRKCTIKAILDAETARLCHSQLRGLTRRIKEFLDGFTQLVDLELVIDPRLGVKSTTGSRTAENIRKIALHQLRAAVVMHGGNLQNLRTMRVWTDFEQRCFERNKDGAWSYIVTHCQHGLDGPKLCGTGPVECCALVTTGQFSDAKDFVKWCEGPRVIV